MSEPDLLRHLKNLVAVQLVDMESADRFLFHHELTRQAAYSSLLLRERKTLHHTVGAAMERLYADAVEAHAAELAYHFYAAEAWDKAFDYSVRAGNRAQAQYAPRAAAEHFTRAIDAARQRGAEPPLELYRSRGQAHETLGEFDAARNDFQALLDGARRHGDRPSEWQALMDLGFLWAAFDYERTGEYFQQALELARRLDDSATLARNLNRIGNWHLNIEQPEAAHQYHLEALRIFESLDDKQGLAATHDLLGITYLVLCDMHQSDAHYERAMALFRELNDRGGLLSSLLIHAGRGTNYLGNTAVNLPASAAEQIRDAEMALQMALDIDARPAVGMSQMWLGLIHSSVGGYGRALNHLREGLQRAETIEHRHFMAVGHMILGALYVDILALSIARRHLEQALSLARETGSHIWMGTITAFLAGACIGQGDLDTAEAYLGQRLTSDLPMQTMPQRQLWAARAELRLAQNRPDEALRIVERLISAAPNRDRAGEHAIPRLGHLRGRALVALNRFEEAQRVLSEACAVAELCALRPFTWRIQASLASLYRAVGRPGAAADAAAQARAIVEELAATLDDADLRAEFRRSAVN